MATTTSIRELTNQIVANKDQLEKEIVAIRSARENIENLQNVGLSLTEGFQSLQTRLEKYLEANTHLIQEVAQGQLDTIQGKFADSNTQLADTQRQLSDFVASSQGIFEGVAKLNQVLEQLAIPERFETLDRTLRVQTEQVENALHSAVKGNQETVAQFAQVQKENSDHKAELQAELRESNRTMLDASRASFKDLDEMVKRLYTLMSSFVSDNAPEMKLLSRNLDKLVDNQRDFNTTQAAVTSALTDQAERMNFSTKLLLTLLLVLNLVMMALLFFKGFR